MFENKVVEESTNVKTKAVAQTQCAGCGKYFSHASVHAQHRVGEFGKNRRCMTGSEMLEAGLASERRPVKSWLDGKRAESEQDVWYSIEARERAKTVFGTGRPECHF